jgi:hypothetical protein
MKVEFIEFKEFQIPKLKEGSTLLPLLLLYYLRPKKLI